MKKNENNLPNSLLSSNSPNCQVNEVAMLYRYKQMKISKQYKEMTSLKGSIHKNLYEKSNIKGFIFDNDIQLLSSKLKNKGHRKDNTIELQKDTSTSRNELSIRKLYDKYVTKKPQINKCDFDRNEYDELFKEINEVINSNQTNIKLDLKYEKPKEKNEFNITDYSNKVRDRNYIFLNKNNCNMRKLILSKNKFIDEFNTTDYHKSTKNHENNINKRNIYFNYNNFLLRRRSPLNLKGICHFDKDSETLNEYNTYHRLFYPGTMIVNDESTCNTNTITNKLYTETKENRLNTCNFLDTDENCYDCSKINDNKKEMNKDFKTINIDINRRNKSTSFPKNKKDNKENCRKRVSFYLDEGIIKNNKKLPNYHINKNKLILKPAIDKARLYKELNSGIDTSLNISGKLNNSKRRKIFGETFNNYNKKQLINSSDEEFNFTKNKTVYPNKRIYFASTIDESKSISDLIDFIQTKDKNKRTVKKMRQEKIKIFNKELEEINDKVVILHNCIDDVLNKKEVQFIRLIDNVSKKSTSKK